MTSSTYRCVLCDVTFSHLMPYEEHLNGKKHKSKVTPTCFYRCDSCHLNLSSLVQYTLHVNGKKHKKKVLSADATSQNKQVSQPENDKNSGEKSQEVRTQVTSELPCSHSPVVLPLPPPPATEKREDEGFGKTTHGDGRLVKEELPCSLRRIELPSPPPIKKEAEEFEQLTYGDRRQVKMEAQELEQVTNGDRRQVTDELPCFLAPIDLPPTLPPPRKRKAEELGECPVCQVFYTSESQRECHISGKRHQKKIQALTGSSDPLGLSEDSSPDFGTCELCHVQHTSVLTREQHLSGAKHRRKANTFTTQKNEERCKLCNVEYTSPSSKLHHLQGRKHQMNLLNNRNPETVQVKNASQFFCLFCNIAVNSLGQLEAHRQGIKHRDIVQKMKKQQQGGDVDDQSVVVVSKRVNNVIQ